MMHPTEGGSEGTMRHAIVRTAAVVGSVARAMLLAAVAAWFAMPAAAAGHARGSSRFATPDQAVQALVDAARADDPQRLMKVLGHGSRKLVDSGDPVADRNGRAQFVAAYDEAHRIDLQDAKRAVLIIGGKQWPLPIPLVQRDGGWRFDTRAGAREVLDRRIGHNELGAIEVCRAFVDAQRDYAANIPHKDGLLEYAQHFMSTPGQHDGLYWPAAAGEPESPMGPLVARARTEGYSAGNGERKTREPYHGYYYRILKRQGEHAADGARDYLVNGRMIGGFALVAFPARHGDSGVMSFLVNQDGVVYQKNLGPQTETIARQMTEFDPDASWTKVNAEAAP